FNYISLLFHQCILWILLIIIMEGMIINECVIAFHQCILWILLIIIMEGMIINECVIAFTLRMNIWERLKL
ncbi:hypothetical protein DWX09_18980, partial [Escherichia coli]